MVILPNLEDFVYFFEKNFLMLPHFDIACYDMLKSSCILATIYSLRREDYLFVERGEEWSVAKPLFEVPRVKHHIAKTKCWLL